MKFNLKNIIINNNCIEIKRKGMVYGRIFLFRVLIQDFHTIELISSLMKTINQKMGNLRQNIVFSIEVSKNSVIFFYLTRESESKNNTHLDEFKKIIESSFDSNLEELMKNDTEKYFWGIFYKSINFSDIIIEEKSFKLRVKERVIHLAIFSIKNFEILTNVLELLASFKIKEFRLYFKNNLDLVSKLDLNLSIESETIDKIQEFYKIISTNFSRESITLFLPNKSLFIQYLLKFLSFNRNLASQLPKFHQFLSPQSFLKRLDFEQVRPLIYIHRKKLLSVIILRKPNLRLVKYFLKTYYPNYFLVFWVLNVKLSKILRNSTKIQSLPNCSLQNRRFDTSIWEKALQLDSENS